MAIPRPEHPRPQFVRKDWQNLNGEWSFAFDHGSGNPDHYERVGTTLPETIVVPFCPESKLSGIGYTNFLSTVWYKRTITIPQEYRNGRVLLHFGAVDYLATVYINGQEVGRHRGGYTSFTLDITDALSMEEENELTVRADDDQRSGLQPKGKQCNFYESCGCDYTRTTGIWQTVWLEFVPRTYLKRVRTDTAYQTGTVTFAGELAGDDPAGLQWRITILDKGETVASLTQPVAMTATCSLTIPQVTLWDVDAPYLYDLTYDLLTGDGEVVDSVGSYVGVRGVEMKNNQMYLNGRPIFQRLVLNQGFYPDGIYTAPDDAALERDILLSQAVGFNGARLHQKVFEERFLYHADRLGYIVWGEHANWGLSNNDPSIIFPFLSEWLEAVERDYNHPAIIGWCPFNEFCDNYYAIHYPDILRLTYAATKTIDKQRPVIDVSGYTHVYPTDFYDTHDYDQNLERFREKYAQFAATGNPVDPHHPHQHYQGGAFFVSEYGGARFAPQSTGNSWGYSSVDDETAFADLYVGLTETILQNHRICGFCYTQLYDIEQEQNGLYAYDRSPKFSEDVYNRIRTCNQQPAACEQK